LKLPFSFPRKVKTEYQGFEDDVNTKLYELTVDTELPGWAVKMVYDTLVKKQMGLSFKEGIGTGQIIEIPYSFLLQKVGILTWEELLLKQNEKVFDSSGKQYHWLFVTKKIKSASLRKTGSHYYLLLTVFGEKKDWS
jgi:hypothetical protein